MHKRIKNMLQALKEPNKEVRESYVMMQLALLKRELKQEQTTSPGYKGVF